MWGDIKGIIPNFQKKFNKERCRLTIKRKFQLVGGLKQGTLLLKTWGGCHIPEILGSNEAQECSGQSIPQTLRMREVCSRSFSLRDFYSQWLRIK